MATELESLTLDKKKNLQKIKHSIGEFLQIDYGPDKAKKWRDNFFDKDFTYRFTLTYNQKTWFLVTEYPKPINILKEEGKETMKIYGKWECMYVYQIH